MTPNEIACAIENGRFKHIFEAIEIKETCMECSFFNKDAKDGYRCANISCCPGTILSTRVREYVIKRIFEYGRCYESNKTWKIN